MTTVPSTFEKVIPDYMDPEYTKPENLYRFNKAHSGFGRWYVEWDEEKGTAKTYVSVSTLINKVIPKSYAFLKWIAAQGKDWEKISDERAVYGSVFHKVSMAPLITGGGFDFDHLLQPFHPDSPWDNYQMLFPKDYREQALGWRYAFNHGLMAFWQFCAERVEKVLAVELPIVDDEYEIAATLDLIHLINFKRKPRLAITDLKSKIFYLMSKEENKTFYESHRFQLEIQKRLLARNYPEMVEKYADGDPNNILIFNWAPNAWTTKMVAGEDGPELKGGPTWTMENQTDNEYAVPVGIPGNPGMTLAELKIWEAKCLGLPKPPSHVVEVNGKFEHLGEFDWTDMVRMIETE